eukprot:766106-Hanusia_phi.AAC.1
MVRSQNDHLAVVTFQRAELDDVLKKRFVSPTLGWEKVVFHVQGLRVQVRSEERGEAQGGEGGGDERGDRWITALSRMSQTSSPTSRAFRISGETSISLPPPASSSLPPDGEVQVVSWTSSSVSKRNASQSHEKEKL